MTGRFFDQKADRFDYVHFTCDRCAMPQTLTMPIRAKTCTCIACQREHTIKQNERSNHPNPKRQKKG